MMRPPSRRVAGYSPRRASWVRLGWGRVASALRAPIFFNLASQHLTNTPLFHTPRHNTASGIALLLNLRDLYPALPEHEPHDLRPHLLLPRGRQPPLPLQVLFAYLLSGIYGKRTGKVDLFLCMCMRACVVVTLDLTGASRLYPCRCVRAVLDGLDWTGGRWTQACMDWIESDWRTHTYIP